MWLLGHFFSIKTPNFVRIGIRDLLGMSRSCQCVLPWAYDNTYVLGEALRLKNSGKKRQVLENKIIIFFRCRLFGKRAFAGSAFIS